jgi:hypothetical protein
MRLPSTVITAFTFFIGLVAGLPAAAQDETARDAWPQLADGARRDAAETAVVVRLLEGAALPSLDALQGWLTTKGRALTVRAVDERPPQVMIVRDPAAQPVLDHLASTFSDLIGDRGKRDNPRGTSSDDTLRSSFPFTQDFEISFVTPITSPPAHGRLATGNVFPYSEPVSLHQGGLLWMLHYTTTTFPLRFADAVAWAASELAATGRRRAVILILGDHAVDGSRHGIAATLRRLAALQVPLLVWTSASVEPLYPEWHGARTLQDPVLPRRQAELIDGALRELEAILDRQRVLWLDEQVPISEIELAPQARKLAVLEGDS